MQTGSTSSDAVVLKGPMWLGDNTYEGASEIKASMWLDKPYGHEVDVAISRPPSEKLDSFVAKVKDHIRGGEMSVSARIRNGCLETTLDEISPMVTIEGEETEFDALSLKRIDMMDDLFEALCDIGTSEDGLPLRPGSCALIVATLSPFIELVHPVRCEASPTGGVIASFSCGIGTVSLHALPQGYMSICGSTSWNPSMRHDIPSAQSELRRVLKD